MDYTKLDGGALHAECRDDAAKWAAAFCQHAEKLGHPGLDEGWVLGWFANAIECKCAEPATALVAKLRNAESGVDAETAERAADEIERLMSALRNEGEACALIAETPVLECCNRPDVDPNYGPMCCGTPDQRDPTPSEIAAAIRKHVEEFV